MSSADKKDDAVETSIIETKPCTEQRKKRIQSMSDDEIIEGNLKELLEKKSREERKANGRLGAVIIAFLVIFLAVYHVWIRKTAGILVSAIIMISYGAWVVLLAVRDKRKRALFEKHLEEIARKNKIEFEQKARALAEKSKSDRSKSHHGSSTTLHFENEISKNLASSTQSAASSIHTAGVHPVRPSAVKGGEHRKHRKHRRRNGAPTDVGDNISYSSSGSSNSSRSRQSSSHHITKDLRVKRPSIRQRLFRQNVNVLPIVAETRTGGGVTKNGVARPLPVAIQPHKHKKQQLQRMNALEAPQPLHRMNSAP